MTDKYKIKIISSLSDILPPLVDSTMKLLDHVKKEEDLYNGDLFYQLVEITYYSGKAIRSFGDEAAKIRVKKENELTEPEIEFLEVYSDCISSFDKINKGISTFLYLYIVNNALQEKVKHNDWYHKIEQQSDASVESAIDNLYDGAKLLTKIIDAIIV